METGLKTDSLMKIPCERLRGTIGESKKGWGGGCQSSLALGEKREVHIGGNWGDAPVVLGAGVGSKRHPSFVKTETPENKKSCAKIQKSATRYA